MHRFASDTSLLVRKVLCSTGSQKSSREQRDQTQTGGNLDVHFFAPREKSSSLSPPFPDPT